jgi:drug/metabolite transporter (DMT)-like permease
VIGPFVFMSLIWGATWLAMKLGVATVPPIFFGGTRFLVAGLLLLLLAIFRGETRRFNLRELGRLVLVQLLIVVLTYAPLFWGILHVPSGLTAVLDLTLMPVSLIGFGIALGEESWSFGRGLALVLASSVLPCCLAHGPECRLICLAFSAPWPLCSARSFTASARS